MALKNYVNFDLRIELSKNGYRARVSDSPSGQATVEFTSPFSDEERTNIIKANWSASTSRVFKVGVDDNTSVQASMDTKTFGERLYAAVFDGDVRTCFTNSLFNSQKENTGLRIRLDLEGVPELAALPWEYLYGKPPHDFFALSNQTPIIRFLPLLQGVEPLRVTEPLRIVVMLSDPDNVPALQVKNELAKLQSALEGLQTTGQVILELLKANLDELRQRLRRPDAPIHILHFIGHGGFDDVSQASGLLFEDDKKQGQFVRADDLGKLLYDHKSLRLIFLNACEGAKAPLADLFAGVAQQLVQKGFPAVIAMQFQVTDRAAINLAYEFYKAVTDGYPIDAALAEARKALCVKNKKPEWGTPVLFMRTPDGQLFGFTDAARYPEFFPPPLKKYEPIHIVKQILDQLTEIVHDRHLLILNDHPKIERETLAYYVAYQLGQYEPQCIVWKRLDDVGQIDLKTQFSMEDKPETLPLQRIFIFPEITPAMLNDVLLSKFQRTLKERNQWVIFTTIIEKDLWKLDQLNEMVFPDLSVYERVYGTKYLTDELRRSLARSVQRLPQGFSIDTIQARRSERDLSPEKIAELLGSPANIDVFVEQLCTQRVDIKNIRQLIEASGRISYQDIVKYWYHQLPTRKDELLAVVLCLLGGLFETQFFMILERIAKGPWKRHFPSLQILDYYHLTALRNLTRYEDSEASNVQAEEKRIEHRYPDQRPILLKIAWEDYRYHLHVALPEIAKVIKDSVTPWVSRREEYGNEHKRRHLRIIANQVLCDIGLLSASAVEDTLVELASHLNWGVQVVSAQAMAQWYTKDENAQNQLFDVLKRWQKGEWKKGPDTEVDRRNIQLTVARTIYYIISYVSSEQLPNPLPELLWTLLQNKDYKVQEFFYKVIFSSIFPLYLSQLIDDWYTRWETSPSDLNHVGGALLLLALAHACEQHEQYEHAKKVHPWLIDVLTTVFKQDPVNTVRLLADYRALITKIFPPYLAPLSDVLLAMAQRCSLQAETIEIFVQAHQEHSPDIQIVLNDWFEQWQLHLAYIDEKGSKRWVRALPTIGIIYDRVGEFEQFAPWLLSLINASAVQQSETVAMLNAIYRDQKLPDRSLTKLETMLYKWLTDSKQSLPVHQIVFLFFSYVACGAIVKQSSTGTIYESGFYITHFVPFTAVLFRRQYQVIVRNLLPIAFDMKIIQPDKLNCTLMHWQSSDNAQVKDIAYCLHRAIFLCNVNQYVNERLLLIRKLLPHLVLLLLVLCVLILSYIVLYSGILDEFANYFR